MTGVGRPAAVLPAPGPLDARVVERSAGRSSTGARRSASRGSTRPRRSSTGPRPRMEANPALIAMAGPARALNTVGGQVTWQATAFGAIVAGLMSMFLVGRHTRAEEESGRDELVRAVGGRPPGAADRRARGAGAGQHRCSARLVALSLVAVPLAVADSVALGVGRRALRAGLRRGGPGGRAADVDHPGGVRPDGRGDRRGLRAARGRRRRQRGAVVARARSAGTSGCTPSPGCAGGRPCCCVALALVDGASRRTPCFERRDIGSGVLAARPGPARAARSLGLAGRAGVAAAARLGGRLGAGPGVHGARVRLDRRRRRRPDRRQPDRAEQMLAAGGGRPGGRVPRGVDGDAGAARRPASRSPRRCARGARRTRGASRRCSPRRPPRSRWLLRPRRGHRGRHASLVLGGRPGSGMGVGYALVTGDGGRGAAAHLAGADLAARGAGAVRR